MPRWSPTPRSSSSACRVSGGAWWRWGFVGCLASAALAGSGCGSVHVTLEHQPGRGGYWLAVIWGAGVTPRTICPSWRRGVALPARVWPSTPFLRAGYAVPCWPERMWLLRRASHPSLRGSRLRGCPDGPHGLRARGWQAATAGPGARCCRGGVGSGAAELAPMAFVSISPGSAAAALPAWLGGVRSSPVPVLCPSRHLAPAAAATRAIPAGTGRVQAAPRAGRVPQQRAVG